MPNCQEFRLVTRADVAQMFGVCVKTVDNYIKEGLLPHPLSVIPMSVSLRAECGTGRRADTTKAPRHVSASGPT